MVRAAVCVVLFAGACNGPTKDTEPTTDAATFGRVVDEILQPSCAFSTCHGPETVVGMRLDAGAEYEALVDIPSMGVPTETLVRPGDANGSYLIAKLEDGVGIIGGAMPPSGSLDPDAIQLFRDWINAGAENN